MIKFYYKTARELADEENLCRFAADIAKAHISAKPCPTYIIRKDGTRVNTRDLTEDVIMELVIQDFRDYSNPNGSYGKGKKTRIPDSLKFIETLSDTWEASCGALYALYQSGKLNRIPSGWIADMVGMVDKNHYVTNASVIAKFLKGVNGDFEPVTDEQFLSALKQMARIEEAAKNKTSGIGRR